MAGILEIQSETMTKLENYIGNGREYYWLAVDNTGKIASFANANVAAIPDLIVQNPEIIEEIVDPRVH